MKIALALLLTARLAFADGFFGGSGGPAGSFASPNFTGTPTFYTNRMAITDGSDRIQFRSDVYEFNNYANDRSGLYVVVDNTHPQLTLQGMDLWMEGSAGGGAAGSFPCYPGKNCDLGYSTFQQADLPGFHEFRHIAYSGTMFYVPTSESSSYTIASTGIMQTQQGGTVAGNNQTLTTTNIKANVLKSNAAGDRYIEQYLGLSSIFKTQQNLDMWINDAKFVSYSSTAAKARVGSATLVSGTVTVTNTNNDANDHLFIQLKTPGGTLGTHYKYSISAGNNFTITAVDTAGSTVTTDTSTVSWWLINKQ